MHTAPFKIAGTVGKADSKVFCTSESFFDSLENSSPFCTVSGRLHACLCPCSLSYMPACRFVYIVMQVLLTFMDWFNSVCGWHFMPWASVGASCFHSTTEDSK